MTVKRTGNNITYKFDGKIIVTNNYFTVIFVLSLIIGGALIQIFGCELMGLILTENNTLYGLHLLTHLILVLTGISLMPIEDELGNCVWAKGDD